MTLILKGELIAEVRQPAAVKEDLNPAALIKETQKWREKAKAGHESEPTIWLVDHAQHC